MKTRIIAVIMLIALALLAVSCTEAPVPAAPSAAAPAGADEKTEAPAQTEEPVLTDEPAVTDEPKGNTIYDMFPSLAEAKAYEEKNGLTFTDRIHDESTSEQWNALQAAKSYKEYNVYGSKDEYERLVRTILGDIPEGTPRITLEQARAICADHDPADYNNNMWAAVDGLIKRFSEYAVPDVNGGSGSTYAYFFLDDEPTAYIKIEALSVEYCDLANDAVETLWEIEG